MTTHTDKTDMSKEMYVKMQPYSSHGPISHFVFNNSQ